MMPVWLNDMVNNLCRDVEPGLMYVTVKYESAEIYGS